MRPEDFRADPPSGRPLLTYKDVAKRLAIAEGTLRWLVYEARFPVIRLGPRTVRFDPDLVDAIARGGVQIW